MQYVHSIGNLTLTAYNSKYSNKTFSEKMNCEKGFAEDPLWINNLVRENSQWTIDTIQKRAEVLTKKMVEIWSVPPTPKYINNPQTVLAYGK